MTEASPMTVAGAKPAGARRARSLWKVAAGVLGLLALGAVAVALLAGAADKSDANAGGETATAVRDKLVVTITESGEVDAKRSTDVRCEVEGVSTIVWVIEEGTVVKKGDRLLELDSADLQEKLKTQEMAFKTAQAAFQKADQAYRISESLRESSVSTAALKAKFALADVRKYLGTELAERVIAAKGTIPMAELLQDKALGGAALQAQRKFQTDIDLANQELQRAASKVEWTRKLKEKGFVTGSELEADELAYRRQQVLLDESRTALDLFITYDFPKNAEQSYSDSQEGQREHARVDARTKSELETARATRDMAEQALALEDVHLKKVQDQLAKCTLRAPQPGMVVYDTTQNRWNQAAVMEVGASVRHQQVLIKLPDMSEMNVKAKLHESVVKQVSEKAPAYVTIDAFPGERHTGTVTKIAIMPDRGNFWLNPGLKAYITEVTLDRTPPNLKPGMSAQVEILVDSRDSVLQVPVSAVYVEKGFQVVYAKTPDGPETRRVEVGLSNDKRLEITRGLEGGEVVYLYKPTGAPELKVSEEEMKKALQLREPPSPKDNGWRPVVRGDPERPGRPSPDDAGPPTPSKEASAADVKVPGKEDLTPEKMKELRGKFDKLSPEEQEKILKRIREGMAKEGQSPGNAPDAGGPGKDRRP